MAQQRAPQVDGLRREDVRTPDEVAAMLRLHALGWGTRRIAAEFGCSRNTVKRYVERGGWAPLAVASRPRALDGLESWLAERFRRHRGNADVVRQELLAEHAIGVSLRTVERAVAPLRRELAAEARATVRFETPPGRQLQIDFGERRVEVGGEAVKVCLFVATLGHSRRLHVRAFRGERQEHWFEGLESAFRAFGGVPEEVLVDNARALVAHHDPATREVRFDDRLLAFAKHWGFRPRACAPYRARTKGKDERGVGHVKRDAIAGRAFASWAALEAHLERWVREVADVRVHGTTGEAPAARFARDRRRPAPPPGAGGGGGAAPGGGPPAVPAAPGADPPGPGGLLRRGRRQRLQRAVAADRRGRAGRARCRPGPHPARRPRGRGARRARRPPGARPRSGPLRGRRGLPRGG